MTAATHDLLNNLNPQQLAAVTAGTGPVLVLAGPGSGKTGVLTRRVAFLIREMGLRPSGLVAVTFTNKAAAEMRHRIENYLGERQRGLQIGTFHATCARILRIEHEFTPYRQDYVIYDTDDQVAAVTQALGDLSIDTKKFPPRRILHAISSAKNELRQPKDYVPEDYFGEIVSRVYPRYQQILLSSNAMDFDDLLVQMVLALQNSDVLREKYQMKFEYVLVDEFQDTNTAQYQLVKLFGLPQNNIFVVGDEDQSIYAFRGADYRNVLRFRQDYPNAQVILLEQNYRSTQIILDVARAVIDKNTNRTPKALFTTREGGDAITVHEAYDDEYEARYVIEEIETLRRKKMTYNQIAIMYRTNAQSRALEDALVRANIPYTLVGGVGFYKRREIKDLLAYLRVINNPDDRISFDRIINTPKRGIGEKSLQEFHNYAAKLNLTMLGLLDKLAGIEKVALPARTVKLFAEFADKLRDWRQQATTGTLVSLFDTLTTEIGYNLYLLSISASPEEMREREENVAQLRGLLARADDDDIALSDFLADTALMSDVDEVVTDADKVTLLTLHAAKGLEYPVVFITGVENGFLPHFRSQEELEGEEEERRLMYVGVTRAKERLFLTYAFKRTSWGGSEIREKSKFLYDVPLELIADVPAGLKHDSQSTSYRQQTTWDSGGGLNRLKQDLSRIRSLPTTETPTEPADKAPVRAPNSAIRSKILPFPGSAKTQYQAGQRVRHPMFGEGAVIHSEMDGNDEKVTVQFTDRRYGQKTLLAHLANMTLL